MKGSDKPQTLSLRGLEPAAPQQLGAVRLVPLLRSQVGGDLRLSLRRYKDAFGVVALDGEPDGRRLNPGLKYMGYVPHGLVMSWSDDGSPITAFGTQMTADSDGDTKQLGRGGPVTARLLHRMVKRESGNRLRFLPLHLAMEGYLSLHFGGPDIAWSEYSRQALREGLDPRYETVAFGRDINRLDAALRTFEIHEGQCGVLLCVADALAAAFVVPHPDDYRLLHHSLIEDFYGDLIYQYSYQYRDLPRLAPYDEGPDAQRPKTLAELRVLFEKSRRSWADVGHLLTSGLVGRSVTSERVYRAGPFSLQRFVTSLRLDDENHIGETIVREDGTVEYLKTYRLSSGQAKRAFLLQTLAQHNWNLDAAAASQNQTRSALMGRLVNAGFGYLIAEHVLRAARRHR